MTTTTRKRIDRIYETELPAWRAAWRTFWEEAWAPISLHELELVALGEWPEEMPESGQGFDEAWHLWCRAIDDALSEAVPGGSVPVGSDEAAAWHRRADLSQWPYLLPEPPEEPAELWACLKEITSQAEEAGALTQEAGLAALLLTYLAFARAVRTVRGIASQKVPSGHSIPSAFPHR